MSKVDTICDNCIKKEVCKYREETQKFKEIRELEEILPENLEINYKCKYKHDGNVFRKYKEI